MTMPTTLELANRGLRPPEPMLRILSALESLPAGAALLAHNDREPVFLFPELSARGYRYECTPVAEGGVHVRIWRDDGR
jgi:tRNA 2-thiouridine synthesizing protein A